MVVICQTNWNIIIIYNKGSITNVSEIVINNYWIYMEYETTSKEKTIDKSVHLRSNISKLAMLIIEIQGFKNKVQ